MRPISPRCSGAGAPARAEQAVSRRLRRARHLGRARARCRAPEGASTASRDRSSTRARWRNPRRPRRRQVRRVGGSSGSRRTLATRSRCSSPPGPTRSGPSLIMGCYEGARFRRRPLGASCRHRPLQPLRRRVASRPRRIGDARARLHRRGRPCQLRRCRCGGSLWRESRQRERAQPRPRKPCVRSHRAAQPRCVSGLREGETKRCEPMFSFGRSGAVTPKVSALGGALGAKCVAFCVGLQARQAAASIPVGAFTLVQAATDAQAAPASSGG